MNGLIQLLVIIAYLVVAKWFWDRPVPYVVPCLERSQRIGRYILALLTVAGFFGLIVVLGHLHLVWVSGVR